MSYAATAPSRIVQVRDAMRRSAGHEHADTAAGTEPADGLTRTGNATSCQGPLPTAVNAPGLRRPSMK